MTSMNRMNSIDDDEMLLGVETAPVVVMIDLVLQLVAIVRFVDDSSCLCLIDCPCAVPNRASHSDSSNDSEARVICHTSSMIFDAANCSL